MTRRTWSSIVFPGLLLGLALFVLNNLGIWHGALNTPDGHVHVMYSHAVDNSIYQSWVRSSLQRFLHPNFQGPWLTEQAVFQPLLVLVARVSQLTGIPLDWSFLLMHLVTHLMAGCALMYALQRFMTTTRERWAAVGMMLLVVPVPSLFLLPSLVLPLQQVGIPPLPGIGWFVWFTTDGFLHGISGSVLVTYGTAFTVAAFALLAAYMHTERRRYLVGACVASLLCGLVHPYEPFLIMGAGSLALLLWRGVSAWRRVAPDIVALCAASSIGVAPTALLALTTPWVHDAAFANRFVPPSPLLLFAMLGLPTLVACVLLVLQRRMRTPGDLVLQCWVGGTLIGLYVPFLPWTQHFLDGFHCAVGMLVVRQLGQNATVSQYALRYRRLATAGVISLAILSLGAMAAYYRQAWMDGDKPVPDRLFTSVIPEADVAAREWLARNGAYDDLVLAPVARAAWFSSVPMHTVAGNRMFSITYPEQSRLSNDFFAGRMNRAEAEQFLSAYGVHWIVMPAGGPLSLLPALAQERARYGPWTIYELPGQRMKPYPGLPR
jgi:hypothetical protein